MRLVFKAAMFAAMIVCPVAAPAQQPQPIELSGKAAFKHRHSKVQLPPVLAGLSRTAALEYESDQLDTMSNYSTADLGEVYTIYIYRHVAGGLPVWFDRARWMLEHRGDLGTATLHAAGPFVPPGRANASGLIATYAAAGKGYTSSGVALVPVGEWLVKLRASSRTLTAGELETRMKAALGEIGWPKRMAAAPAAGLIAPCSTALALSGDAKPAEKDEDSGAEMLMSALLGQMGAMQETTKGGTAAETTWCRDPAELPNAGVYRADGQVDGYLLALADSGRGVSAGRSSGQILLEASKEKKGLPERYEVQLILLSQTMKSGLLDRLPPPAQALQIVNSKRFASSFGTWGKGKGRIVVGADMLQ